MRPESRHKARNVLISGSWRCRWIQDSTVGFEELQLLVSGRDITGSGTDLDGIFEYEGAIYEEGTVSLTKRYLKAFIPVPPTLSYIGRWDGQSVSGEWIADNDPGNHGPFCMWPWDSPEPSWQEQGATGNGQIPAWLPPPSGDEDSHGR